MEGWIPDERPHLIDSIDFTVKLVLTKICRSDPSRNILM